MKVCVIVLFIEMYNMFDTVKELVDLVLMKPCVPTIITTPYIDEYENSVTNIRNEIVSVFNQHKQILRTLNETKDENILINYANELNFVELSSEEQFRILVAFRFAIHKYNNLNVSLALVRDEDDAYLKLFTITYRNVMPGCILISEIEGEDINNDPFSFDEDVSDEEEHSSELHVRWNLDNLDEDTIANLGNKNKHRLYRPTEEEEEDKDALSNQYSQELNDDDSIQKTFDRYNTIVTEETYFDRYNTIIKPDDYNHFDVLNTIFDKDVFDSNKTYQKYIDEEDLCSSDSESWSVNDEN